MIFLRIAVVSACAREVMDPLVHVMFTAGAASRFFVRVGRRCRSGNACSRNLLGEQFRAGHEGCHRCDLAKEFSSSVDAHSVLLRPSIDVSTLQPRGKGNLSHPLADVGTPTHNNAVLAILNAFNYPLGSVQTQTAWLQFRRFCPEMCLI